MNRLVVNALYMGIAATFAVSLAACNRDASADAGAAGTPARAAVLQFFGRAKRRIGRDEPAADFRVQLGGRAAVSELKRSLPLDEFLAIQQRLRRPLRRAP